MPSINVDFAYFGHRKTKRLIRLLGRGSEVLPLKLWIYTGIHYARDGRLTGISAEEIEDECQWWGKPGEMIAVMLREDVGFLQMDGDVFVVHDWGEHQGHIWASQEKGRQMALARWGKLPNADSNADSITASNANTNCTNSRTGYSRKTAKERALEELKRSRANEPR